MRTDDTKHKVSDTRWARSLAMLAWLVVVVAVSVLYLKTRDGLGFSLWSVVWLLVLAALIAAAGVFYVRKSRPPKDEPEKPDAKDRVALLIVHGMGVQDRFQMLDDFARSMPVYTEAYARRTSLLTGAPKNEYLPLQVGDKQVDVHEAFWGHLFNRLVTLPKTLVFTAKTLVAFAPKLFTRFWRKRLAEALYVGAALAFLYVMLASLYCGVLLSSQQLDMIQVEKEQITVAAGTNGGPSEDAQALGPNLVSESQERKAPPPWAERVKMTSKFAFDSVAGAFSPSLLSQPVSFERPIELLKGEPTVLLLYSVLYCVSFGFTLLSVLRLALAQFKFWMAGGNGPADNPEYERAVNEVWTKNSWGAIKGGIVPLAGLLVFDPVLDPVVVHLVATFAVLVLFLKGLSWWLKSFLGDVMIYATLNANAETYDARERATELVADKVRALLADEHYQRVIVVAHSLGSVIATNAVRRVYNKGHENFAKLGAFVTIGSPLRKFRMLFKAKPYLWAFGDNAIQRDGDIFIGEEYKHKGRVPWFNYWYGSDVFSDRLAYEPWGELKKGLVEAAENKSQRDYAEAVVKAYKTSYEELDTTGFRVGDRRDCNLGPRPGVWTHSDYWLDHRFVDDLLLMTHCDDEALKTMSVALKPTLDANKRNAEPG